jgi:hypothetical protein
MEESALTAHTLAATWYIRWLLIERRRRWNAVPPTAMATNGKPSGSRSLKVFSIAEGRVTADVIRSPAVPPP